MSTRPQEQGVGEWATPEFREAERKILIAMYDEVDPDFGYFPFKLIASRSGVPLELVKPLVRLMKQRGEADFMRGLMNEDGGMVGSGYGLTEKGRDRAKVFADTELDKQLANLKSDTTHDPE